MLRKLLLLIGLFISVESHSQFFAHCTIYNEDNEKFTVYLDGEKKNEEPQTRVRVINLTESFFKLKVVFENPQIPVFEKKMFRVADGNNYPADINYKLKKNKRGEYNIHWMTHEIWPGYIKSPLPLVNRPKPPNSTSTPCSNIISESDFNTAIASIEKRETVDAKMLASKQLLSTNCVSVDQVKKIMNLFTSESAKLVVAQYSYGRTADPQNYFKLNDEFKEDKNIEVLYKMLLKE